MSHSLSSPLRRAFAATSLVALMATALGTGVAAATTTEQTGPGDEPGSDAALTTPFALVEDRDVDDRLPQPEDRYALAGAIPLYEALTTTPGGDVATSIKQLTAAANLKSVYEAAEKNFCSTFIDPAASRLPES